MEVIDRFADEYYWLSNFENSPFTINSITFPTVEHYFQASKATSPRVFEMIRTAKTPSEAKRLGKNIALRKDWEEVKDKIMYEGFMQSSLKT